MNFKPNFATNTQKPGYEPVTNYMVQLKNLITFRPEQSIEEVIDIIIEKRISGGACTQ
ncbi:MAG: hypothetical protein HC859_08290 [Bacteroidia bacterium]|nr:hypothetical protein [Bacteroidia bacterium]